VRVANDIKEFGFGWQEGIVEKGLVEAVTQKVKLEIERIGLEG